jgi:hypothetical protein
VIASVELIEWATMSEKEDVARRLLTGNLLMSADRTISVSKSIRACLK